MCIVIDLEDRKLKIVKQVLDLISSYKQISRTDCEAGGILIGRENKESGNIIVEYSTTPYDKDKCTRTSFQRKDERHVKFFEQLYNKHNGIYAYLGEWHTHPEDYPQYSMIDKKNWRDISKLNIDNEKFYYHIIVGNKEIRIWQYNYKKRIIKRIY